MIDVNVRAVHFLTKKLLKQMRVKDRGFILNVASSAGLIPAGPYMAAYYRSEERRGGKECKFRVIADT